MELEVKNLNVAYKKNPRTILKEVNLNLKTGEYVAIVGESGSGKSTLLACLAGILKPSLGAVIWRNENLYELSDHHLSKLHRSEISYVPQSNVFIREYTVADNLVLPYSSRGRIDPTWEEKAVELLELFGLKEMKERFPYELSGGELKRASIARALVMTPDVIIADEPTTGLDQITGERILQYLSEYANLGKLVIIASHDQKVLDYCNVIYKIDNGKVGLYEG